MGKVNAVVFNRMRNRAGFSADEWKIAYNQVKALSDRRQLDERALVRFIRFGYGHHAAAALTVQLKVAPGSVRQMARDAGLPGDDRGASCHGHQQPELFEQMLAVLPWRELPSDADKTNVRKRFEALSREEADDIFELWRAHAFRRRAEERRGQLTQNFTA